MNKRIRYLTHGAVLAALYVAIGEEAVLLSLGILLFYSLKRQHLDTRLFA